MLVDELEPSTLTAGLGPLPAPRSYATMVLGRLAACSPDAEPLVAAVAVAGALSIDGLARMTGCVDPSARARPRPSAAASSTCQRRGGRRVVDVAHPLIRSAVLDDLSPGRLCALHAAAAAAVDDPDRAFRHELRAHLGTHPELAAEAIRRAHARLADGWELSAVELLVLGADLLGPGPARSAAVLQASHWLLTAGDTAAAADLLATAGGADTPLDRLVRGELALLAGDSAAAGRLLEEAVADDDLGVAARAAGLLATIAANAARADEAMAWARRALELSVRSGTDATFAMTMLVSGWALEGDLGAAEEEVAEWVVRLGPAATGPDVQYARGVLALWGGRLAEAERILATLIDGRVGHGLIATSARYSLADCWYRQGRLDEALGWPLETVQLLEDSEQLLSCPMAHGIAASVLGGARRPRRRPPPHRGGRRRRWRRPATSPPCCGSSPRRPASPSPPATRRPSSRRCSRWPTACATSGCPTGTQPWRADLVTALVAVGRLDDAARELADLRGAGPVGRATRARGPRPCGRDPRRGPGRRRAGGRGVRRRPRRGRRRPGRARPRPARARGRQLRAAARPAAGRRRPPRPRRQPVRPASGPHRSPTTARQRARGVRPRRRAATAASRALTTRRGERRRARRRRAHEPRGRGVARRQREDGRVTPRPHLRQARRALAHRAGDRVAPRRRHRSHPMTGPTVATLTS